MVKYETQDDIFRKMSPAQKLQASMALYYSARQAKASWLKQLHHDWSQEQIQKAVTEIFANAGS